MRRLMIINYNADMQFFKIHSELFDLLEWDQEIELYSNYSRYFHRDGLLPSYITPCRYIYEKYGSKADFIPSENAIDLYDKI